MFFIWISMFFSFLFWMTAYLAEYDYMTLLHFVLVYSNYKPTSTPFDTLRVEVVDFPATYTTTKHEQTPSEKGYFHPARVEIDNHDHSPTTFPTPLWRSLTECESLWAMRKPQFNLTTCTMRFASDFACSPFDSSQHPRIQQQRQNQNTGPSSIASHGLDAISLYPHASAHIECNVRNRAFKILGALRTNVRSTRPEWM